MKSSSNPSWAAIRKDSKCSEGLLLLPWTGVLLSPSPAQPHRTPCSLEEPKLEVYTWPNPCFTSRHPHYFGLHQPCSITGLFRTPPGWTCSKLHVPGEREVNNNSKYMNSELPWLLPSCCQQLHLGILHPSGLRGALEKGSVPGLGEP